MAELKISDMAPDFRLKDAEGKEYALKDFLGRRVVLYFYPKDDTPGCTKEACSFRDDYDSYVRNNIAIIGISPDSTRTHKTFADKHNLPFLLLSDPDKEAIKTYGARGEKKMYGKTYWGLIRMTFLIDENARIMKVYPKVRVEGHSQAILSAFGIDA
ncbi:MAG: thioredoxin-dependent thiol peroxidase [FCB group bacterium]|nr:thioredoxin-dependent thiol peroxidase [FCB group bacterium]